MRPRNALPPRHQQTISVELSARCLGAIPGLAKQLKKSEVMLLEYVSVGCRSPPILRRWREVRRWRRRLIYVQHVSIFHNYCFIRGDPYAIFHGQCFIRGDTRVCQTGREVLRLGHAEIRDIPPAASKIASIFDHSLNKSPWFMRLQIQLRRHCGAWKITVTGHNRCLAKAGHWPFVLHFHFS